MPLGVVRKNARFLNGVSHIIGENKKIQLKKAKIHAKFRKNFKGLFYAFSGVYDGIMNSLNRAPKGF